MKTFVETCRDCGARYQSDTPEGASTALERHQRAFCPLRKETSEPAGVLWWQKLREGSDAGFADRLNTYDRIWLPAMGIQV